MSLSLIAAIGKNRELGKNGGLIFRLPSDLKFFKEATMGHPVVMGRKTFESLPKMLPGRKHYVVTRDSKQLSSLPQIIGHSVVTVASPVPLTHCQNESDDKQLFVVSDLTEFLEEAKKAPCEFFVIGGGMLYQAALEDCDKLYLTEVDAEDPEADTFFPEIDYSKYDRKVLKKGKENGIEFAHVLYTKKK